MRPQLRIGADPLFAPHMRDLGTGGPRCWIRADKQPDLARLTAEYPVRNADGQAGLAAHPFGNDLMAAGLDFVPIHLEASKAVAL
jgi:hypothetical protein